MRIITLLFIVVLSGCTHGTIDSNSPEAIQALIAKQKNEKRYPFEVIEYKYQANIFYAFMGKGCCDLPGVLYNSSGKIVCRYSGYANYWQPPCENFNKEAVLVKTIFTSN